MGLFDFLHRKPNSPAEFTAADIGRPRCHHYTLAHYALRQAAHEQPLPLLAVLASPDAKAFLADLLRSVHEHCREREPEAGFTADDLTVHKGRVGKHPCVVVQMPPPHGPTEAYFAAAVPLVDLDQPLPPKPDGVQARYFTLEQGVTLGGPPRTVLCEWEANGTHANYGDGPAAELGAFVRAVEEFLEKRAA